MIQIRAQDRPADVKSRCIYSSRPTARAGVQVQMQGPSCMGLAGLACRCVLAQSLNDGEQDQPAHSPSSEQCTIFGLTTALRLATQTFDDPLCACFEAQKKEKSSACGIARLDSSQRGKDATRDPQACWSLRSREDPSRMARMRFA